MMRTPLPNERKDTKKIFTNAIRKKILDLFLAGGKYSVTDLCDLLHIPDPRSHIRYIRNAGYPISDYLQKSAQSKYKVYFMHRERVDE